MLREPLVDWIKRIVERRRTIGLRRRRKQKIKKAKRKKDFKSANEP